MADYNEAFCAQPPNGPKCVNGADHFVLRNARYRNEPEWISVNLIDCGLVILKATASTPLNILRRMEMRLLSGGLLDFNLFLLWRITNRDLWFALETRQWRLSSGEPINFVNGRLITASSQIEALKCLLNAVMRSMLSMEKSFCWRKTFTHRKSFAI